MTLGIKPNAENFKKLGQMFIDLDQKLNLHENNLNFNCMEVYSNFDNEEFVKAGEESCGTVACHGGWGSVLFNLIHLDQYEDYSEGASAIASFLGFHTPEHTNAYAPESNLTSWAHINPKIWGNEHGRCMFTSIGYMAFGQQEGECTLADIGNHYIQVAQRLKESQNDT